MNKTLESYTHRKRTVNNPPRKNEPKKGYNIVCQVNSKSGYPCSHQTGLRPRVSGASKAELVGLKIFWDCQLRPAAELFRFNPDYPRLRA